jgi:hypothetical protein
MLLLSEKAKPIRCQGYSKCVRNPGAHVPNGNSSGSHTHHKSRSRRPHPATSLTPDLPPMASTSSARFGPCWNSSTQQPQVQSTTSNDPITRVKHHVPAVNRKEKAPRRIRHGAHSAPAVAAADRRPDARARAPGTRTEDHKRTDPPLAGRPHAARPRSATATASLRPPPVHHLLR